MANKIQTTDVNGSCGELLRAMDLIGISDSIGSPGVYTCYKKLDLFDLQIGVLPGNFSAQEIEDLFKAAAFEPTELDAIQFHDYKNAA